MIAGWLVAAALGGEVTGEISGDVLHATLHDPEPADGAPETVSATDLGMRVRADLLATDDDRLHARLDYRGREPLPGALQNDPLRLLYAAEVGYALVEGRLDLSAGRFLAPTAVLLPVDGLRAEGTDGPTTITLFGGRRGFDSSRRNLGTAMLPAAGLALRHATTRLQLDGAAAWAEDRLIFAASGSGEHEERVAGPLAHARGSWRAHETLFVGGQLAFASHAFFLLGPTWDAHQVEVQALDLWSGLGWASWRPAEVAKLDYTLHHQSVGLYGTVEPAPDDLQAPRFLDNRLRASVAPLGTARGWLRADVRHRVRHDRTELRLGASLDVQDLVLTGPYLTGAVSVDDLQDADDPDVAGFVDRLYWTGAAGWERGWLDVQAGASFTERTLTPVSGRTGDLDAPDEPAQTEDLSPFVLDAQEVAFVRGFVTGRRWFAGADLEASLRDREVRALLQVGLLADREW